MSAVKFATVEAMSKHCLAEASYSPNVSRVISFLLVAALLLIVFAARRRLQRGAMDGGDRAAFGQYQLSPAERLEILGPAICGLVVFASVLTVLRVSGFYDEPMTSESVLFLQSSGDMLNAPVELAARAVWAIAFSALVLASAIVIWTAAGAWLASESIARTQLTRSVAVLAFIVVALLVASGTTEFGPRFSSEMLCATWIRTDSSQVGPVTDGLNMLGICICVVVAWAFCLLLIPTLRSVDELKELSLLRRSRQMLEFDRQLRRFGHTQRLLDQLLYAGAAVLMAGLVEVVTLMSWSYAPFQGVAQVKLHSEICKAPPVMSTASAASAIRLDQTALCTDIPRNAENADQVDDARQFVRSLALVFGVSFSALLMAFYGPAAMVLQRRLRSLLEIRPSGLSKDAVVERMEMYGVERTIANRSFSIAASLGPMVAGAVSAFLNQ